MELIKNSYKRNNNASGLPNSSQKFKLQKSSKPAIPVGKHVFQIVGANYQRLPVIWFTLECKDVEGYPHINLFAHCVKKSGEQNIPVTDKLISLYEDLTGTKVTDTLDYKSFDDLLGKFVKGGVVINEYQGEMHTEVNIFSLKALNIELIDDEGSSVQEGVEEDKKPTECGLLLDEVESEPANVPTKDSDVNTAS